MILTSGSHRGAVGVGVGGGRGGGGGGVLRKTVNQYLSSYYI